MGFGLLVRLMSHVVLCENYEIERTTEGIKGGVIFLAIRSSQLIGEKKEWNLSSSWREKEIPDEQTDREQASRISYL